jgi:hypothetical protein
MLRRFNAIGREGPILKELEKMPGTTLELFNLLLDECQKSRNDQDLQVLRRFFAWLAYAKEPLRLCAASRLLHFLAKDNTISIDEEVEHKSARYCSSYPLLSYSSCCSCPNMPALLLSSHVPIPV